MILFFKKLVISLLLFLYLPSFYLYSEGISRDDSSKDPCPQLFSSSDVLYKVKSDGVFVPISQEFRQVLEEAYWQARSNDFVLPVRTDLRHVYDYDLDFTLPASSSYTDPSVHWEAINNFRGSSFQVTLDSKESRILSKYDYDAFSDTYFFTSVGGAWARGGSKTIKFEVPLNIEELTTEEEQKLLMFSDKIFQAKQDLDILLSFLQSFELFTESDVQNLLGAHDFNYLKQIMSTLEEKGILTNTVTKEHLSEDELPEDLYSYTHNFALHCKELLADYVSKLITSSKKDPRALNIVDLKIALTAVLSEVSHLYFPMDFWTGEHTHNTLKSYIESFYRNFSKKQFSTNPELNEMIISAISNYLQASKELGETFLFGYMELIPPIDNTLSKKDTTNDTYTVYWQNQPGVIKNSPGASSFFGYLDTTGRREELLRRGIRYLLFNNLEVLGPVHKEIDAFRKIIELNPSYDLAFIVVPKQFGYAGGFPVIDSAGRKLLLEESQVAKSQRESYGYFNTNTGIFKLEAISSVSKIGFEKKEQGRISRTKGNLGDSTNEYQSALIGGEIGDNYLNFKGYGDYLTNGTNLINKHFMRWVSILLRPDQQNF